MFYNCCLIIDDTSTHTRPVASSLAFGGVVLGGGVVRVFWGAVSISALIE
jgi:hypothetical protein